MDKLLSDIRIFLYSKYVLVFAIAFLWAVFARSAQAQFYAEETYGLPPSMQRFRLGLGSMGNEQAKQEEDWDEEYGVGRSFFFLELVLSGLYSFNGVTGIPMGDATKDHFEISPRPPSNYIGFDYVKTFASSPRWFPLTATDLHPRMVYNRMEMGDDLNKLQFAPQDFWLRFNPGGVDRLILRVGQFVLPYGVNPILAPRQRFILPIEASDLGLKWDWGLSLKGPIGDYDWEIAATIGSGEGLHTPHLFTGSDRASHLFTGRIGSPTYWDFQHGISFLLGDLPAIMGPMMMSEVAISRWRIGYDAFYKNGTYLMFGGQLTYGQDGFAGDEEFVGITMGKTANTLGVRAMMDWVIPKYQNIRLATQFESVFRDLLSSKSHDTAAIFEVGYSFTTAITARLDNRYELHRSMGQTNNAIYLTLIYYASN